MRIWIQGKTERDRRLAALLKAGGHAVVPPEKCELAILSLPRSNVSEEEINRIPVCCKILCGISDESLEKAGKEKQWDIRRIFRDEAYTRENAELTAEGAVFSLMQKAPFAVRDAVCLVIGYGRIGKALTRLLRGLGAEVIVAARRKESRLEAGKNSIGIPEIASILGRTDAVFNTVPSPVLPESGLLRAQKEILLVELASKPYGIDRAAAEKLGLSYSLESGVPGRYCPQSAAGTVERYLERVILHE